MDQQSQHFKALPVRFYLQVLLCAILWGSAFPVIKNSYSILSLDSYGEMLIFAGTRFMLAGLLVLPFCRTNVIQSFIDAPKRKLWIVILGQTYFQYVFFYLGIKVSSGTLGALLNGIGSFWWLLLGPLILKTPQPRPIHWVILVFCSLGIAIAVYSPGAGSGNVAIGTISFMAASLAGALAAIYLKDIAPRSGSRAVTCISLFIGGVLLTLTALPYWESYLSKISWQTAGLTLYLAMLSATAFTIWNRLIETYSVQVLSTFRFLIPLCGVIESALFIQGETIGPGIVLGGTIIIACLIIISRVDQAKPK
jgi:drug/metabolite transporter (DMT)-like permease